MQSNLEKLQEKRSLFTCLLIIGIGFLIANIVGKEVVKITSDVSTIVVAGILAVISVILYSKFRSKGHHGKAWLLFMGTAISWFIAEATWATYELVLNQDPFPSTADLFYLIGYPFLFLFTMLYLKPFKKLISKKLIIISSLIAVSVLVPNLYMTLENNSEESELGIILGATYPIADAVVLVPTIIGIVLFVRGEVNFLWTLLLIGILFEVVGDTGFQYFSLNDSYYTGHPVDILFNWAYVLFSFGIYNHIKIFKKEPEMHEKNTLAQDTVNQFKNY